MPYLTFPGSLLREQASEWPRLTGSANSAGRSFSGVMQQSRADGGGLWSYGLQSVALRTPDQVRAWNALAGRLGHGEVPVIVPFCNKRYFPAPVVDGAKVYSFGVLPHSDDTLFSDGSGYAQNVVDAELIDAALLRATSLSLRIHYGGALRGGDFFSIDHAAMGRRLYSTMTVEQTAATDYAVTIAPPLRAAVGAATPLDFDAPGCVMQLAAPMQLVLEQRKFGNPSVAFIESFLPEPAAA